MSCVDLDLERDLVRMQDEIDRLKEDKLKYGKLEVLVSQAKDNLVTFLKHTKSEEEIMLKCYPKAAVSGLNKALKLIKECGMDAT